MRSRRRKLGNPVLAGAGLAIIVACAMAYSRCHPIGRPDEASASQGEVSKPAVAAVIQPAGSGAQPSSGPAVSASRKDAPVDEERFQELTERARETIPTLAQLQSLKGEAVHHMPVPLVHAAIALGALAQAVHDNPALAPAAAEFYRGCAGEATYPVSIRALCYSHVRGEGGDMPAAVKSLAANIPG